MCVEYEGVCKMKGRRFLRNAKQQLKHTKQLWQCACQTRRSLADILRQWTERFIGNTPHGHMNWGKNNNVWDGHLKTRGSKIPPYTTIVDTNKGVYER